MVLFKKIRRVRNNLSKKIFFIFMYLRIRIYFVQLYYYYISTKKTLDVGVSLKSDTLVRDVYTYPRQLMLYYTARTTYY